jgi:hypothetical protein
MRLHDCLALGALLCGAAAAHAQSRPAVVELFTSEGCSSCPPAEDYLGELARRNDVLALGFHVDYWDDLGWRDRFAVAEAVPRQRRYARTLRLASVYTPQIVIDGGRDFVGSDRPAIAAALARPRHGVAVDIAVGDGDIRINVGPQESGAAQEGAGACDVVVVAYRRSAVSAIGRGENAGRTLAEFNIVRALRTVGTWSGPANTYHAARSSLPEDATDVAVLVQSAGQAQIVGAAMHALR